MALSTIKVSLWILANGSRYSMASLLTGWQAGFVELGTKGELARHLGLLLSITQMLLVSKKCAYLIIT